MVQQAKSEGLTINVRHAKIVFCGAAKAGKTSFSRLLRNEEHDTVYESTPAGDTKQVLISRKQNVVSTKVNVVDTRWISLDKKLEIQHIVSRLILKLKNANKDKSSINNDMNTEYEVPPSDNEFPASNVLSRNLTELKDDILDNQSIVSASSNKSSTLSDTEESSDDSVHTSQQTGIENEMIAYTDNVDVPISELDKIIPDTWDLFTLLDTGGQPEFINMLPAINSSTAITFVVLNMSKGKKCLKNSVIAQYECEEYSYNKCISKYTNIDLLKCLLFSIKFSAMKQNFDPKIVTKVTEDEHPESVVSIIGTCADVLKEAFGEQYNEELSEINKEVKNLVDIIKEKENKERQIKDKMVFWCKLDGKFVIPVDNTIFREPQKGFEYEMEPQKGFEYEIAEEVQRIREHSNEILRKKAQYEIPITWFILELELRNQEKVCISLTEVKDICDRIMPSHRKMKMKEIKEVLKFYHLYGMLLYFSEVKGMKNYVITNPQWLFTNLTKILMCKFAQRFI